ncbi:MAG: energy-coupling factor transporter transmembrane protein EcfT [Clostridia bacterium]|nr:energy-coupling factor transporter transmembrane protein EcfT [Clostridia bacterium]
MISEADIRKALTVRRKSMNEFKTYHPIVNLVYFLFTLGFSMVFMHPLCLFVSLASAFAYSVMLGGVKALKTNLLYMLPMILFTSLLNPLFNHEGVTVIAYLPDGNPLTLESAVFGIAASVMLVSVICRFSCFNAVMTDDKFIYLFGRVMPTLSLILSMTLRFVPRFLSKLKQAADTRRCVGNDPADGNTVKRAKNGLALLSAMVTWALENSVDTADSMRSRGYGLSGRTAFSIFVFDRRDALTLALTAALGIYTLAGALLGAFDSSYFPILSFAQWDAYTVSVILAYTLLCVMPIIIEIKEKIKWKSTGSKI